MKLVIIGGGCAGLEAAAAARANNPDLEIVLYSADTQRPYRRPALPRKLYQDLPDGQFFIQGENFFAERNIQLELGKTASVLDREHKQIFFTDGEQASYDKLILTMGANPVVPPLPGVNLSGVSSCRNLSDLEAMRARQAKNIIVLGGGLLGLEMAEQLLKTGATVTVVELSPILLPRQLDKQSAEIVARKLAATENLQTRFGLGIAAFLGDENTGVSAVELSNGEVLPCDLAVLAIGVRPNCALAEAAGLEVNRGIVVNAQMVTSDPDIAAAGDCANFANYAPNLWLTARDQGKVAGTVMAGGNVQYTSQVVPARLMAFQLKLFSIGRNDDTTRGEITQSGDQYRRLSYDENGKLCGAILLGDLSEAPELTRQLTAPVN